LTRRVVAAVAIAAIAALVAGCSQGGYPGVLDTVTPRADDPMTPDQVKQATDDLISDRNQLNAQAPANASSANATGSVAPATGAAAKP
jgi:hypothetical protein